MRWLLKKIGIFIILRGETLTLGENLHCWVVWVCRSGLLNLNGYRLHTKHLILKGGVMNNYVDKTCDCLNSTKCPGTVTIEEIEEMFFNGVKIEDVKRKLEAEETEKE